MPLLNPTVAAVAYHLHLLVEGTLYALLKLLESFLMQWLPVLLTATCHFYQHSHDCDSSIAAACFTPSALSCQVPYDALPLLLLQPLLLKLASVPPC